MEEKEMSYEDAISYIKILKEKLDKQTKEYQKILQEQQLYIDNLERNCDVFNEQMNDAVERATELQQEKEELIKWLKTEYMCFDNESDECIIARQILSKLKESDK